MNESTRVTVEEYKSIMKKYEEQLQERIDKEREDKLNQKKLIKNNLIELFSQQFDIDEEDNDKEINISNNSLIGDNEDEKSLKKLNTFSSNYL